MILWRPKLFCLPLIHFRICQTTDGGRAYTTDIWEAVEEIEADQTIEHTDYQSNAVNVDVQAVNVEVLETGNPKGGLAPHVLNVENVNATKIIHTATQLPPMNLTSSRSTKSYIADSSGRP